LQKNKQTKKFTAEKQADAQAHVDAVKARVAQNKLSKKNLLLTLKLMLKQN
jgi:hypothetical protein